MIGEQALAAYQAKKAETKIATVNDQFNNLLIDTVKGNKRPREDQED